MVVPFAALALGSQLVLGSQTSGLQPALDKWSDLNHFPVIAVADTVPDLAVEQNCREQAKRTDALGGKNGYTTDAKGCMRSENTARDKLKTEWTQFTPATRERCTAASTMGGMPSYVELLTCLEMDRDARQLEQQNRTATGQGRK